jgi:hypothetical protein
MDNQYTFTQEDMQRLTAIVHIDDARRVPEQVMNLLEGLLLSKPIRSGNGALVQAGDKIRIIKDSTYFSVGEIAEVDFVDDNDTELPVQADGIWISMDDFELVREGGVEA